MKHKEEEAVTVALVLKVRIVLKRRVRKLIRIYVRVVKVNVE